MTLIFVLSPDSAPSIRNSNGMNTTGACEESSAMAASAKSSSAIAPELLTSFGDFRFDEHPTIEPQMAMASVTQTNNARNLFLFIDLSVSLQNGGQVRSKDLKIFQNISSILKFSKFLKISQSFKNSQMRSRFLKISRAFKIS